MKKGETIYVFGFIATNILIQTGSTATELYKAIKIMNCRISILINSNVRG